MLLLLLLIQFIQFFLNPNNKAHDSKDIIVIIIIIIVFVIYFQGKVQVFLQTQIGTRWIAAKIPHATSLGAKRHTY
jgi:hypothetical protein